MSCQRLRGHVVIVTGATSGIGHAIARRCVVEGAIVVANGRRRDALEAFRSEHGERVAVYAADLSTDNAPAELVEVACHYGRLRGVVHAAGTVLRDEDARSVSAEQFRAFLDENLTPAYALAGAAFSAMADGDGGSIVLVGSQLAHVGAPGYATYSTAKGGITALARTLAAEAGPHGVRVNVLAPGLIRTPMAYVDRENFDELSPAIAERHPLRRIGDPDDLAGPAVFLLSDDARWVTGHTLIVDGGFTAV